MPLVSTPPYIANVFLGTFSNARKSSDSSHVIVLDAPYHSGVSRYSKGEDLRVKIVTNQEANEAYLTDFPGIAAIFKNFEIYKTDDQEHQYMFSVVASFLTLYGLSAIRRINDFFLSGKGTASARYHYPFLLAHIDFPEFLVERSNFYRKCQESTDISLNVGVDDAKEYLEAMLESI